MLIVYYYMVSYPVSINLAAGRQCTCSKPLPALLWDPPRTPALLREHPRTVRCTCCSNAGEDPHSCKPDRMRSGLRVGCAPPRGILLTGHYTFRSECGFFPGVHTKRPSGKWLAVSDFQTVSNRILEVVTFPYL